MNTIDELKYYCNEKEPVGAIMLTGEWGSGKTYLIEHELKEILKDTHILVRVSLFGIGSIEEMNAAVKKKWVETCKVPLSKLMDSNIFKGIKHIFDVGVETGDHFFSGLSKVKNAVLSIDPNEFITIKPSITTGGVEKKVILIFDDLERSKLDTVDILGCINDYCENQNFNTIIIANEEKINKPETNDKTAISYDAIKEKIVARTVVYKPDYSQIVHSIIQKQQWADDRYKSFLQENELLILDLLETQPSAPEGKPGEEETNKKTPSHNIRSLKCALQDFYRVYAELCKREIQDSEKTEFLYSFVAYVMADKAGLIKKSETEPGYYGDDVRKIYPFFNERTLPGCIQRWIKHSDWNEDKIGEALDEYKRNIAVEKPKDILRVNKIFDVEDRSVAEGFKELLEDCYKGDLTLNEYVRFIENAYDIRKYNINIPQGIKWDKIYEGIKNCEEKYVERNRESDSLDFDRLGWEYIDKLSKEEQKAYDLIDSFWKNEVLLFESNRQKYIQALQTESVNALRTCRRLRFKAFDEDMASKTAKCFEESSQEVKAVFPAAFSSMWKDRVWIDFEATQKGFAKMRGEIEGLSQKYEEEGKTISKIHADSLITVLKEIEQLVKKAKKNPPKTDLFIDL